MVEESELPPPFINNQIGFSIRTKCTKKKYQNKNLVNGY